MKMFLCSHMNRADCQLVFFLIKFEFNELNLCLMRLCSICEIHYMCKVQTYLGTFIWLFLNVY